MFPDPRLPNHFPFPRIPDTEGCAAELRPDIAPVSALVILVIQTTIWPPFERVNEGAREIDFLRVRRS